MKRFLILLVFFSTFCISAYSQATIKDVKFSIAQVFDVQWSISGGNLTVRGLNYLYGAVNYATQTNSAARLTAAQYADINSNGRYIAFYDSPTVAGTYGLAVFNSSGTIYKVIDYTGTFRALANGAIFYNGNGMWGTLFTTGQGYSIGTAGPITFSIVQDNPSNAYMSSWTPTTTEPLAPGQTATPPAPPPPVLCCGASSQQFNASQDLSSKVMAFATRPTNDSKIYVNQIGDYNKITVDQSGTKNNYVKYEGNGNNNTTLVTQSSTNTSATNYVDIKEGTNLSSSNNQVNIQQTSTGGAKGAFVNIQDNNNVVILKQQDSGNHWAEVSVSGGNKSVDLTQQGSGNHMASVQLTGPQPASLVLQQAGGTSQYYSIQSNCTTPGGCAPITVTQGR